MPADEPSDERAKGMSPQERIVRVPNWLVHAPSPNDPIRRRGQLASLVEVLEAFRDGRIELFE